MTWSLVLLSLVACKPLDRAATPTATPTPEPAAALPDKPGFILAYQARVGGEFEPCG